VSRAPLVIAAADVAALLGCHVDTFHDRWPALRAAGFPAPLPGFVRRRWSRLAVEAWIRDPAAPDAIRPLPPGAARDLEAELADRAARLADRLGA
jgi:hypothetical protein